MVAFYALRMTIIMTEDKVHIDDWGIDPAGSTLGCVCLVHRDSHYSKAGPTLLDDFVELETRQSSGLAIIQDVRVGGEAIRSLWSKLGHPFCRLSGFARCPFLPINN